MVDRTRQTERSFVGTPAEMRSAEAPASLESLLPFLEMITPGSGLVTGTREINEGDTAKGISDYLAELFGATGALAGGGAGSVVPGPGTALGAAAGYGVGKGVYKAGKAGIESLVDLITKKDNTVENISIFPKPERMFPADQRPKGGEYLNPKTGDILTDKNVESASIYITPEGKPKFDASPIEKEIVGSPSTKGATQIKTNLFKKSAGWKWLDVPDEYKDIPTLVSVQNKGKHYYSIEANFPEGVNLTRYANSPSEPRLRPTVKGFVDLGKQIGTISVRGKEHPVYDKIVNRYAGGSVIERNPYNYEAKAI
jgi:hypothetical protein